VPVDFVRQYHEDVIQITIEADPEGHPRLTYDINTNALNRIVETHLRGDQPVPQESENQTPAATNGSDSASPRPQQLVEILGLEREKHLELGQGAPARRLLVPEEIENCLQLSRKRGLADKSHAPQSTLFADQEV
jgi:hypothetical protein